MGRVLEGFGMVLRNGLGAGEVWEAVLGWLEGEVSRANFDTWLKGTRGLSFDGGKLVVGVPSIFVAEWLEKRLYSLIEKTLIALLGRQVGVEFRLLSGDEPSPAALNPRYTFSNFIVGDCNRLAYTAAWEVAHHPGTVFNPLFIYAGAGLGKTHLLQAIGHVARERCLHWVYISAERFTSEFVSSLHGGHPSRFREKFRRLDMLLVDDIHFLGGKKQTQSSFLYTLDELCEEGKQVVVSASCPPEACALGDSLTSRLTSGLVATLHPPDMETRTRFLEARAHQLRLPLDPQILEYLSRQPTSSMRELEGYLNRLLALAKVRGKVDLDAVSDLIGGNGSPTETLHPVIRAVSGYFRVSPGSLWDKSPDRKTALIRSVAIFLLRENGWSFARIGNYLKMAKSSVIYNYEKLSSQLSTSPSLQETLTRIRALLPRD